MGGPPNLQWGNGGRGGGGGGRALYTGCCTISGLMAKLHFGKQPDFMVPRAHEFNITYAFYSTQYYEKAEKVSALKSRPFLLTSRTDLLFLYVHANYWTGSLAVETDNKLSLFAHKLLNSTKPCSSDSICCCQRYFILHIIYWRSLSFTRHATQKVDRKMKINNLWAQLFMFKFKTAVSIQLLPLIWL